MARKNVWLKDNTAELLTSARAKFVRQFPKLKPYDDTIIKHALEAYINEL